MKAILLEEFGPPGVLKLREVADPSPGPGEILLRIRACGICGHDVIGRSGDLRGYRLPLIMGHEFAGEVVELGPGVEGFAVGDRVASRQHRSCHVCNFCRNGRETLCPTHAEYGETIPGGYAELCVVDPAGLVRVPDGVGWAEAAIAACAVGTIVHAFRLAGVRIGERILVTGAGGGLGIHAIQLARAAGCEVVAVTSSERKVESLAAHADHVILTGARGLNSQVRDRSLAPDVVIELTAGVTLDESLRAVRRGGRVVIVGNVDPNPVPLLPGAVIVRELAILGSNSAALEDLEAALKLMAAREVTPVISHRLPLSAAAEGHAIMESKVNTGRVVLEVPG